MAYLGTKTTVMRKVWPVICLFLLLCAACKRDKEVVVPGNEAPPDGTITDLVLENYINRSYITLLGHQPDASEIATGKSILRIQNVSLDDRGNFLDLVIAKPGYAQRLFDLSRASLLSGVDTSDIRDELDLIEFILSDSVYLPFWPQALIDQDQLTLVMAIPADLQAATITTAEMHRRLVTNKGYDQINMGTQNFVVSMFQNFLARYPTDAERTAGEIMVDGFSSQLFLESGRSKTDFIAIFLRSLDYHEGQVRDVFRRYLYREPNTEELETLTIAFKANGDFKALQKAVLSKNEFIGL